MYNDYKNDNIVYNCPLSCGWLFINNCVEYTVGRILHAIEQIIIVKILPLIECHNDVTKWKPYQRKTLSEENGERYNHVDIEG